MIPTPSTMATSDTYTPKMADAVRGPLSAKASYTDGEGAGKMRGRD